MTQSEALVAPLRVLAVLFSVGVGGYLVWAAQERQGPAPQDPAPVEEQAPDLGAEPAADTPNVASEARAEGEADTTQPDVDPVMLYSSKSALIDPMDLFPPLDGQPLAESSEGAANNVDPVLLFSSKSAPIDPEALEAALEDAGVEVEPQPRFLPSSKVIITPEMMPKPEEAPVEPEQEDNEKPAGAPTSKSGGSRP
ncbi:MAG: hypothetical protein ACYS26_21855 [Planctomycetota bacterium]